jgi:hypothetical protein
VAKRERNAPSIASQPSFHHGHWWVDRAKGLATSVTFWENADTVSAYEAKRWPDGVVPGGKG